MYYKTKNQTGFSLIEILIAISIFILLSILVVINFRGNDVETALSNSGLEFSQALRTAQNYGLTCKVFDNDSYSGYGILINTQTSYILYADKNENLIYDDDILDVFIQEFYLPENVRVDNLGTNIVFKCPDASICIDANCARNDEQVFNFQSQVSGQVKKIILDIATGKVDNIKELF